MHVYEQPLRVLHCLRPVPPVWWLVLVVAPTNTADMNRDSAVSPHPLLVVLGQPLAERLLDRTANVQQGVSAEDNVVTADLIKADVAVDINEP